MDTSKKTLEREAPASPAVVADASVGRIWEADGERAQRACGLGNHENSLTPRCAAAT